MVVHRLSSAQSMSIGLLEEMDVGGVGVTVNSQRKGFVVIIGLASLKRDHCSKW